MTDMIKTLKFVQGAVSRKDFIPALTHFRIENGTIRSYNGMLSLCSPISLDINCSPKAEPLVKAIGHCDETVSMSLTPAGRLSVKSGSFKALIDCIQEETPHVMPEGDEIHFNGETLLKAFKTIYPFIGSDASRPWANGILLKNQSAFATNNVTLVEYWVGATFPIECNIPKACIKEMLRIGEAPTHAQVDANSITFHYSENTWIRTQLFSTEWPDLAKVLDQESTQRPLDPLIFDGLEKMKSFVNKMGHIYMSEGLMTTSRDIQEGAEFNVVTLQHEGLYNIEMLMLLKDSAITIDWSTYPAPCMFQGERLRGAIVGMRL